MNNHTSTSVKAAKELFQLIQELNPNLLTSKHLESIMYETCWTEGLINKLLLIIKYNSQSIPIHGTPSTELFCIISSFGRLNHSCSPNVCLSYEIINSNFDNNHSTNASIGSANQKNNTLFIKMLTTKQILPGEEICISYLSNLCVDLNQRKELLNDSFHFNCNCERCTQEQHIHTMLMNTNNKLYENQQINRLIKIQKELEIIYEDHNINEESNLKPLNRNNNNNNNYNNFNFNNIENDKLVFNFHFHLIELMEEFLSLCKTPVTTNISTDLYTYPLPSVIHDLSLLIFQINSSTYSKAMKLNPTLLCNKLHVELFGIDLLKHLYIDEQYGNVVQNEAMNENIVTDYYNRMLISCQLWLESAL
eukprot:gene10300-13846_t